MLKLTRKHKDKAVEAEFLKLIKTLNSLPITKKVDPPANSTSVGLPGQIAEDTDYIYFCFQKDQWNRITKDVW